MSYEASARLIRELEGLRAHVYDDATGEPVVPGYTLQGHPTIGYGRKLDSPDGIGVHEAEMLLKDDLEQAWVDAAGFVGPASFDRLATARKLALVAMAYQMGSPRLAKFVKTRKALLAGNWHEAAREALDSRWAREQTPERARKLAKMIESGKT